MTLTTHTGHLHLPIQRAGVVPESDGEITASKDGEIFHFGLMIPTDTSNYGRAERREISVTCDKSADSCDDNPPVRNNNRKTETPAPLVT